MSERRQYKHPPIQEAVCDIAFEDPIPWTIETPGLLHDALREYFPGTPEQEIEQGLEFEPDEVGPVIRLREGRPALTFPSDDALRQATVRPDRLTVHVFRPYPGWEVLLGDISAALDPIAEIRRPRGVTRIGVRYINSIPLPGSDVRLGTLLAQPPESPDGIDVALTGYFVRTQSAFRSDPSVRVIRTIASTVADESPAVILDLDVSRVWEDDSLPLADCLAEVERLRDIERSAFEASITDAARGMFDE